jgi:hypothetical protein
MGNKEYKKLDSKCTRKQNRLWERFVFYGFLTFCLVLYILILLLHFINIKKGTINLNDGKPVINANMQYVEAGVPIEETFFLENNHLGNVYYQFSVADVRGELAPFIDVTIMPKNSQKPLFSGKLQALMGDGHTETDILYYKERRNFTISMTLDKGMTEEMEAKELYFSLVVKTVQARFNPDREFPSQSFAEIAQDAEYNSGIVLENVQESRLNATLSATEGNTKNLFQAEVQ